MSINRYQFERLNIIHELFQKGGKYSVIDLLAVLIGKLSAIETNAGLMIGVSRKTLLNDIKYLRSKGAPIPNSKKYYYSEPFSFLEVLGTTDLALLTELKTIVGKLQAFNKINEIIDVNFDEVALRISDNNSKMVMFDNFTQNLTNYEFLPEILNHIQNQRVLEIKFRDFNNIVYQDTFHPYLLKEYNGRWYVFGLSENQFQETGKKQIYLYPIDRISSVSPLKKAKLPYFVNNWWNAEHHFSDMVGVTKKVGQKPERIVVRVYGNSVDYLLTKKIHSSQNSILEEDEYSDFEFFVIDNYEFRSKLLALGLNAEVLEPNELRKSFAEITAKMRERYLE